MTSPEFSAKENISDHVGHIKSLEDPKPIFKSTKPLTVCQEILLQTELRAKERKEFENYLKQKEQKQLFYQKRQLEQKKFAEEMELRQLRQSLVHKARPFKVLPKFESILKERQLRGFRDALYG
ncbi:targeting protein for Xklp2-A-like isoform X2 [Zophobas morio]|uniref:targeting protein for Xklp2-A-like isoform X2 n=1 Tax=Zophobas morio TaxID=2755281 RepID=UPI003082F084